MEPLPEDKLKARIEFRGLLSMRNGGDNREKQTGKF